MKIKDYFLSGETFELRETSIPGILKTYPVPENLDKYYESKNYISHYQDTGSLKEKLYKIFQRFNFNYKRNILNKNLQTGTTVLDYGCGAGEFLKFIEKEFKTFGFEPNTDARDATSKKLHETTLVSDLNELEDSSLDAITLWHVLEHIENQQEIFENFYKKLKSGGILIIAVPNPNSYDALHYGKFWAAYDVPRHLYHFTKKGMENFVKGNEEKWHLKKIRPLHLDSYYISLISEKYKKNPLFFIFGLIHGAISNFKASKTNEFSSLIYIIEKK